jgi:hypothetical protein
MTPESLYGPSSYRVTLFFGPELVEGASDVQACVFNVKKRSWKAGVQVTVEITHEQLGRLRQEMRLMDRMSEAMMMLAPDDRPAYQERVGDLFAQAVAWCKLDLGLAAGLAQENQRIPAVDLVPELERSALDRREYVTAYILSELDLVPESPPPTSS